MMIMKVIVKIVAVEKKKFNIQKSPEKKRENIFNFCFWVSLLTYID